MKINKLFIVLLSAIFVTLFSACSSETTEFVTPNSGTGFTSKYCNELKGVTGCEYERIDRAYVFLGHKLSMGPTDPAFRGVIYLDEEEAENLFNSYKWNLYDDTVSAFDLGSVYVENLDTDDWYFCHEFNSDYFYTTITSFVLFNGKDTIIFSVQTF